MLDRDTHRLLALFGDKQPHSFFETLKLGTVLLQIHERKFEKIFKRRLLANNWVRRCGRSWSPQLDFYELTTKGDEFFRLVQIWRITRNGYTDDNVRHYRYFNRSTTGKYGVTGMGTELSEKMAGLKGKYPELYN